MELFVPCSVQHCQIFLALKTKRNVRSLANIVGRSNTVRAIYFLHRVVKSSERTRTYDNVKYFSHN
jgi:hypothetical protein